MVAVKDLKVGDKVQVADVDRLVWVAVASVEISYTVRGADTVTVRFVDGGVWTGYPADMEIKVR